MTRRASPTGKLAPAGGTRAPAEFGSLFGRSSAPPPHSLMRMAGRRAPGMRHMPPDRPASVACSTPFRGLPRGSQTYPGSRGGNARKAAYSWSFAEHVIAASPEIKSSKASPSRSCHCSRVWTRSERPADCCKRELNLASRSAVLSVCNCWCIVGVERNANRGRRSRPCRPRSRVRPPSRDASGCRVLAGDIHPLRRALRDAGRLPEARGTRPGRSDSPEQTNANSSTRERAAIAPEET